MRFIEASNLNWNVGELMAHMDRGTVDFAVPVQRGLVWDNRRDSLFIHSLLMGISLGEFHLNKKEGKYEGLEGKQRSRALYNFIQGTEYKLHLNTPDAPLEGGGTEKIARKKFKQLSEELQNRILRKSLFTNVYDDLTMQEKVLVFTRINSSKPVTSTDIARIRVKSRDVFLRLITHPAIKSLVSPKKQAKLYDEDMIEDAWCITFGNAQSLTAKHRDAVLSTAEIPAEQEAAMNDALDYFKELLTIAASDKKVYKRIQGKIHSVMMIVMAIIAIENEIPQGVYVEKAMEFMSGEGKKASTSDAYNEASQTSTTRSDNVQIRKDEVTKALME